MQWGEWFSNLILERGYDYYQEDRVKQIDKQGPIISATVEGSEVYDVEITVAENGIRNMFCSCPYAQDGNNCKHMVATLLEAQDTFMDIDLEDGSVWYRLGSDEDEYDEEDEYDFYEETIQPYHYDEGIERILSLATEQEKDEFIKRIIQNTAAYYSNFTKSLSNPMTKYIPINYKLELHRLRNDFQSLDVYIQELFNHFLKQNWLVEGVDAFFYILEKNYPSKTAYKYLEQVLDKFTPSVSRLFFTQTIQQIQLIKNLESVEEYQCIFKSIPKQDIWFEELDAFLNHQRLNTWNPFHVVTTILEHLIEFSNQIDVERTMEWMRTNVDFIVVRYVYIDTLLNNGNWKEASSYLEFLEEPFYGRNKISFNDLRIKLYKLSGNEELYQTSIIEQLMASGSLNMSQYKSLKQEYSKEEWASFVQKLLRSSLSNKDVCKVYAEEKDYESLIECLNYSDIDMLRLYENQLGEYNPQWILDKYESYIEIEAQRTATRKVYAMWADLLMHMLKYEAGNDRVYDILERLKRQYPNRPAMLQELRVVTNMAKKPKMRKIALSEIIQALEMTDQDTSFYYSLTYNKIKMVRDLLSWDEEYDEDEEEDEDFIVMPDYRDINEYDMMYEFIGHVKSPNNQEMLYRAINGKGAFRRFKQVIRQQSLEKQWYAFRDEQYKKLALEWCEQNGFEAV